MFLNIQELTFVLQTWQIGPNWLLKYGLWLLKKWLYFASHYFEKNISKNYQKLKKFQSFCQILRPSYQIFEKKKTLIVSFLQSFIVVLTTTLPEVQKYL